MEKIKEDQIMIYEIKTCGLSAYTVNATIDSYMCFSGIDSFIYDPKWKRVTFQGNFLDTKKIEDMLKKIEKALIELWELKNKLSLLNIKID